jgi:hypothetical protein
VDPGPVERLVGINVADTGQKILIQEEGFDHSPFSLNPPDKFPG